MIARSLGSSLRSRMLASLLTIVQASATRSRPGRKAPEAPTSTQRPIRSRAAPIVARRPNHYWMADLTVFPLIGSPEIHLAALIDVYSRRRLGQGHLVGQPSSEELAALLHQVWRTVKQALDIHNCPPPIPGLLAEPVHVASDWYNRFRPHQALDNATPAEVFGGAPRPDAAPAPRCRRGAATEPLGIVTRFALPAERRLPYLERAA